MNRGGSVNEKQRTVNEKKDKKVPGLLSGRLFYGQLFNSEFILIPNSIYLIYNNYKFNYPDPEFNLILN